MANIEKEKRTVAQMVRIYCFLKHKQSRGLCDECSSLLTYAHKRLDGCKFGDDKNDYDRTIKEMGDATLLYDDVTAETVDPETDGAGAAAG